MIPVDKENCVSAKLVTVRAYAATSICERYDDDHTGYKKVVIFYDREDAEEHLKNEKKPRYITNQEYDLIIYNDPVTGKEIVRKVMEEIHINLGDEKSIRERALSKLTPRERQVLGFE